MKSFSSSTFISSCLLQIYLQICFRFALGSNHEIIIFFFSVFTNVRCKNCVVQSFSFQSYKFSFLQITHCNATMTISRKK